MAKRKPKPIPKPKRVKSKVPGLPGNVTACLDLSEMVMNMRCGAVVAAQVVHTEYTYPIKKSKSAYHKGDAERAKRGLAGVKGRGDELVKLFPEFETPVKEITKHATALTARFTKEGDKPSQKAIEAMSNSAHNLIDDIDKLWKDVKTMCRPKRR